MRSSAIKQSSFVPRLGGERLFCLQKKKLIWEREILKADFVAVSTIF